MTKEKCYLILSSKEISDQYLIAMSWKSLFIYLDLTIVNAALYKLALW